MVALLPGCSKPIMHYTEKQVAESIITSAERRRLCFHFYSCVSVVCLSVSNEGTDLYEIFILGGT